MRSDKIVEYFDKHSDEWEIREKEYMHYFLENIFYILKTKRGNILDAGCGTGRYLDLLSKKFNNVYGMDISENMIYLAKKKGYCVFLGDCNNLPFKDNSFDVILSIGVLEHLGDYSKALQEMKRVAKKEVIALNLNYLCPINYLKWLLNADNRQVLVTRPNLFFPWTMKNIFKTVGFKNVKCRILAGFSPSSFFSFLNFFEKISIINYFGGILIVSGSI